MSLAVSADGELLYVPYSWIPFQYGTDQIDHGAVMVYSIDAIDEEIKTSSKSDGILERIAINDVWDGQASRYLSNLNIDVRAALRVSPDSTRFSPEFEVYEESQSPLFLGGHVTGIAIQPECFVQLVSPTITTNESTPTLSWKFVGAEPLSTKLFVSTHAKGDGLFPNDLGSPDGNPNRIVNGKELLRNNSFTLPDSRALTRGQTYYWGIESKQKMVECAASQVNLRPNRSRPAIHSLA